jgi:hypothetical protein
MKHVWKVAALTVAAGVVLAGIMFTNAPARDDKTPSRERLLDQAVYRATLLNCYAGAVDRFDDRISPAIVVASAVAWHCEADRNSSNYWVILSQRRASPDTVDMFYRDLALPFVLERRVQRSAAG